MILYLFGKSSFRADFNTRAGQPLGGCPALYNLSHYKQSSVCYRQLVRAWFNSPYPRLSNFSTTRMSLL